MPEKFEGWKCELCGERFWTEEDCCRHEKIEKGAIEGTKMLEDGFTLKEINDKLHLWNYLPVYLENATKDHCFKIPHWQSCNKPAYRIKRFYSTSGAYGEVVLSLFGCGSWAGYYHDILKINSQYLRQIYDPDELFIDKRFRLK